MKRIHIIGGKNHGKTTLVTELVQELTDRGIRVGTIKHTHHQHELDAPAKDSHRHRKAGAAVVGIQSRSMNAVFWPPEEAEASQREQRYDAFAPMFARCDLVLVEGDKQTRELKVEVWRKSLGTQPMAETDQTIVAVVTHDQCPELTTPIWSRADIASLANNVLTLVASEPPNGP